MTALIRAIRADEGPLLKVLYFCMTTETPTAFVATVAELEQRTDGDWQAWARGLACSSHMTAFVAEDHGEACGFVAGRILTRGQLNELVTRNDNHNSGSMSDTTLLNSMWVAPAMRGRGLSQLLIGEVLAWAKMQQQRRVLLAVADDNARAIRVYERANFIKTENSVLHPGFPGLRVHIMEQIL